MINLELGQTTSSPNDDASLEVIKNQGYDYAARIALGCEQYAMMNEAARIQKGPRLLSTLLDIVVGSELYLEAASHSSSSRPEISNLIKGLMNALIQKKSNKAWRSSFHGTQIYYLIYTLAQAMSYEEDSVIKNRYARGETDDFQDSYLEGPLDYTSSVDDVDKYFAAPAEDSVAPNDSVARQLLDRLNALLFSNPTFSQWHRRIITMGSGYESSLHVLTFRKEYSVPEMRGLLEDPRHNDSRAVISRILKMDYFWQQSYAGKKLAHASQGTVTAKNFQEQFAYEALALDELVRIFNADTIKEVAFENAKSTRGKYATQHNTILEQLALVFLAAKCWYKKPEQYQAAEGVLEDYRTPFIPALSLLASGFAGSGKEHASFESMMQSLLEKACDSFNAMLRFKDQEKYALKTPAYAALKQEVTQWLKDTPEILKVYVARTLETGVHCEEKAELIFQVFSQASDVRAISAYLAPEQVKEINFLRRRLESSRSSDFDNRVLWDSSNDEEESRDYEKKDESFSSMSMFFRRNRIGLDLGNILEIEGEPYVFIRRKSDGKNSSGYDGIYVTKEAYDNQPEETKFSKSEYKFGEVFFLKMFPKGERQAEGFAEILAGKVVSKMISERVISNFYANCFSPARPVELPNNHGFALWQAFIVDAIELFKMDYSDNEFNKKNLSRMLFGDGRETLKETLKRIFGEGYETYFDDINLPLHGPSFIIMMMLLLGNYSLHSGNIMVSLGTEANFTLIDYGAAFRKYMDTWSQEDIFRSLEENEVKIHGWVHKKYLRLYRTVSGFFQAVVQHAQKFNQTLENPEKKQFLRSIITSSVEETYKYYKRMHKKDWKETKTDLFRYIYGKSYEDFYLYLTGKAETYHAESIAGEKSRPFFQKVKI